MTNQSPSRNRSRGSSQPDSPPHGLDETPSLEEGSAGSGMGSWGAGSFVADAGPEFDPEQAPPAPDVDPAETPGVFLEEWDEQRIREFLELQGEITHAFLAVDDQDDDTWLQTERDLRAIAPPLTRIFNRYDATRAAAAAGDEILLASGIARYASRNYMRRRRYLAARAAQGPRPITGVPAEPGAGPEDDPTFQRVTADPLGGAPPAITPKGGRR
jgi:hypothetical protein